MSGVAATAHKPAQPYPALGQSPLVLQLRDMPTSSILFLYLLISKWCVMDTA